ncbi:MAG: 3'-5' exonuclease [Bdellovibrionaceae bacterium]|nr:3'-5' exonuclease [Pseudobdellovibrionaceae bacterium]
MDLNHPWTEYTFVAFDTETSGAWPIGCDIVEFGAVKWQGGKEIDQIQMLFKPREPMTDFIIGIHGITNEMVEQAPPISQEIRRIGDFFRGAVSMAHHAPFDLGFVTIDLEANGVALPEEPALCTSLLSRKLIHGTPNHKLQTLVQHLGIDGGSAHRALDDARSCLQVGLKCFETLGPEATLEQILKTQEKRLFWKDYQILKGATPLIKTISEAIREKAVFHFVYDKGHDFRGAKPMGIVRNPDGDFMQALCMKDGIAKRFYLSKIKDFKQL